MRLEVAVQGAVKFIAATLGYDVHHAAQRLPVLSFKAARLHLNFLNEIEVDAGTQRSKFTVYVPNPP